MDVIHDIIKQLESKLKEFSLKENELPKIEEAIGLCRLAYNGMKKRIILKGFKNNQEEVYFFKVLKPKVYSQLLYYNSLYCIEIKRPSGSKKTIKRYLEKEIVKINKFNKEYKGFYQYYKSGAECFDENFFTRCNSNPPSHYNLYLPLIDADFSTMHDFTLSMIQANEMLTEFLVGELNNLDSTSRSQIEKNYYSSQWTGKKIFLVELIYAVYISGVVNNGNIKLNKLKENFEQLFDIELKDFYRSFIEIKRRKINRTKFMDLLKKRLNDKLDELDL